MLAVRKQILAIFVDHATQQWIVRDSEGSLWIVPSGDNGWENREPFEPTDETELEPIPGHYKYLLHLPI